ncbi:MAG: glycosyltransferase family 4 protein [Anaerolineae bacterium]
MHIAINAHLLSMSDSYRGAGIHRYIRALLEHLPQVSHHRITAYLGDPRAGDMTWHGVDSRLAPFPTVSPPARVLWEQLFQPAHLVRENVNLLHGPAYALPLICPTRSAVTVHDLSFFLYPQTFNRGNRLYLKLMTRLAVRRADAVITVSKHTRQDVIRLLDVPAGRVHTVPNGIDQLFYPLPAHEVQAFREVHQLPERFILCISTIEPRKNLTTLIRAYAALGEIEHRLVIGGGRGWQYESVFALVDELGLNNRVWLPGFVRHEELPYWYNAADAFVFPSIYEGFGLPPLEAMACGTPVIVSNTSSLPEVVGSAGLLVDPTDVNALAEAIHRVLTDDTLAPSMAAKGLARAERFSWKASAERTVAVYDSVLRTYLKTVRSGGFS